MSRLRRQLVWVGCLWALATCRQAPKESECARLAHQEAWNEALTVCRAAVEATHSADETVNLVRALIYTGRHEEAATQAQALLVGPRRADGLWAQGQFATKQNRHQEAVTHYALALAAHRAAGQQALAARDAYGLTGAYRNLGDLAQAQLAAKAAAEAARLAGDRRMLVFIEIGRSNLLRQAGDWSGAEQALFALLVDCDPADRSWVLLNQGMLYLGRSLPALARAPLDEAAQREAAASAPHRTILKSVALNRALMERKLGRWDQALGELDQAEALGESPETVHFYRGATLAEAGRLAEAATELAKAQAALTDGDEFWAWEVALARGEVAERFGHTEEALAAYRRSCASAVALHRRAGNQGPQLLSTHREPFARAFGLLARADRWREALDVVAQLDVHSLIASLEPPAPVTSAEKDELPARSPPERAPSLEVPPTDTILSAWVGRHLVVVVSDGAQLWRFELENGQAHGVAVGDAAQLEAAAAQLEADPSSVPIADQLGEALVPKTSHPVEYLLVGPIARTPLGALRHGGKLIIDHTPLARVLGVVPRARHAVGQGPALVAGDPRGDLPAARTEVQEVARRLNVTPHLGPTVTLELLRAGLPNASLLHLAAHGEVTTSGSRLLLGNDSTATAADLAALPQAPRLVVLASCGAAAARDDAGWGSLAAAFLDAGAQQVVASPWAIGDASTLEVVREFYAHGGARDPVRGLALAQAALVGRLPPRDWAGFTVILAPPELSPAPQPF